MVSSVEGLVTTSVVEDIATSEHPATETTLSRSRHFKHGGTNPTRVVLICWASSESSLIEDLHETLSVSLDPASFEHNLRKAFHERLRAIHDDFQLPGT